MKIKNLKTSSFGKFDSREWDELSPSVNVFYGQNEAGKTTLHHMMTHLLYGFKTMNPEKNRFVNHISQGLNVAGTVEENGDIHVERTLKKKGLSVVKDGTVYIGENEPLDLVEHIGRDTYESVYALNLDVLQPFKDKEWSVIESQLLQQFSGDTFKDAKDVLETIETEMKVIKKKTDRGNSIIKDLEEERREVFKKKRAMQDDLEEIERLQLKIDQLAASIDVLKKEKLEYHHKLNTLMVYMPVMKYLKERQELEKQLERYIEFKSLDSHTYKTSKKEVKRLYLKMDDVSEKISKFVYEKRKLLELLQQEELSEVEVNEMYQKYLKLEQLFSEEDELSRELLTQEKQFKRAFENTFEEGFKNEHIERITELNYLSIKSLVQEIESVYEEIKVLKRNKRTSNNGHTGSRIFMYVLLMAISGVAFYFYDHIIIDAVSMMMIGVGAMGIVYQIIRSRHKQLDEDDLFEERDLIRSRLLKELKGFKLSSIAKEYIGKEFLAQLVQLQAMAEQYNKDRNRYDAKKKKFEHIQMEVYEYIGLLGQSDSDQPFKAIMEQLENQKKHESRIAVINGQLDIFNDQLLDYEQVLNEQEAYLKDAESFLSELGNGDTELGLDQLNGKVKYELRLEELNKRLAEIDYDEYLLKDFMLSYKESGDQKWFDQDYLQTELELLTQSLNDKIIESGALEKDLSILKDKADLSSVMSELKAIDEELQTQKEAYDQLLLMHYLIETSESEYRKAHQPEVFKQAGQYLNQITSGKYSSLEVVEYKESKSKYAIHVQTDQGSKVVDQTFSLGTLNQIYLSLRLSLMDHLDEGYNKLPICFDELLVNWDSRRLNQIIEIIKMISVERQVMIFTCHDWLRDALSNQVDAKIFNL